MVHAIASRCLHLAFVVSKSSNSITCFFSFLYYVQFTLLLLFKKKERIKKRKKEKKKEGEMKKELKSEGIRESFKDQYD